MNDKELLEYSNWMIKDTFKHLVPAVVIYAVALGAYWVFIG